MRKLPTITSTTQMPPVKPPKKEIHRKEFLEWIYERLINIHKENPNIDYMRRLRKIIRNDEITNRN